MEIRQFQQGVDIWMQKCFGPDIPKDKMERNFRLFEESIELVQACGMSKEDALRLIDYVYDRPIGDIANEIGGVIVTLSALCTAHNISLSSASQKELDNVWTKIDKIREKQKQKTIRGDNTSLP